MSVEPPGWLPEQALTDGDFDQVISALHRIFIADFVGGQPHFGQMPVWWNQTLGDRNYENGFWHLVTRTDQSSGDRLFDPPRARRLPWCAPTIEHSEDVAVRVWDYTEGSGRCRTYVWLYELDYCVVIEKRTQRRGPVAFLITAYAVDGEQTRKQLRDRYEEATAPQ